MWSISRSALQFCPGLVDLAEYYARQASPRRHTFFAHPGRDGGGGVIARWLSAVRLRQGRRSGVL